MYYFTVLAKYMRQVKENEQITADLRERLREHPDSKDAARGLDAKLTMQRDADADAAGSFKLEYENAINDMRRANKARLIFAPTQGECNILMTLKEISCPPDGLLLAAQRSLSSTIAKLALVSIARQAWAHDKSHKLPAALLDFKKPISEEDTKSMIDAIEKYLRSIEEPDAARAARQYDNEADFLQDVLGLDEEKQQLFKEAISMQIEKY